MVSSQSQPQQVDDGVPRKSRIQALHLRHGLHRQGSSDSRKGELPQTPTTPPIPERKPKLEPRVREFVSEGNNEAICLVAVRPYDDMLPATETLFDKQAGPENGPSNDQSPSMENLERTQTHATRRELQRKRNIDWVTDDNMLRAAIPQIRVVDIRLSSELHENMIWPKTKENEVNRFWSSLAERAADDNTIYLFVGQDVGCMVIQEAFKRFQSELDTLKYNAGFLLLDPCLPLTLSQHTRAAPNFSPSAGEKEREGGAGQEQKMDYFADRSDETKRAVQETWFFEKRLESQIPKFLQPRVIWTKRNGPMRTESWEADDPDYQCVLHHIRKHLLLKSSTSNEIAKVLKALLRVKNMSVNVKNELGYSPLHMAALNANSRAMTALINNGRDGLEMVTSRDRNGDTPLHTGMKAAVEDSDPERFLDVLKTIIRHTVDLNEKNNDGRTAWDIASDCPNPSLLKLKDYRWVIVSGQNTRQLKVEAPQYEPQVRVCRSTLAALVDFYIKPDSKDSPVGYGELTFATPTIYDVLYDEHWGLDEFLWGSKRKPGRDYRCSWIHLPANNVQWISDVLFHLGVNTTPLQMGVCEGDVTKPGYMPRGTQARQVWEQLDGTAVPIKQDAVGFHMPFLAFEVIESRAKLVNAMQWPNIEPHPDVVKEVNHIRAYKAERGKGVFQRRSLDEYSYPSRSAEQVISRHTRRQSSIDIPLLMVDRLWLWVLGDGKIITSFANSIDSSAPYNSYKLLLGELQQGAVIESADAWASRIIQHCVDIFQRQGPSGAQVDKWFQAEVTQMVQDTKTVSKNFTDTVEALLSEPQGHKTPIRHARNRKKQLDQSLDFMKEYELLESVRDTLDELNLIKSILEQQRIVLERLLSMADDKSGADKELLQANGETHTMDFASRVWVDPNLHVVEDNIRTVEVLIAQVNQVQNELSSLMNFKQVWANAWEARMAREGSDEMRQQGQRILQFTFVTVIFLPLSFISSFFGIDVRDFPQDPAGNTSWPLAEVFGYMFGLSAAVILFLYLITVLAESKDAIIRMTRGSFHRKAGTPIQRAVVGVTVTALQPNGSVNQPVEHTDGVANLLADQISTLKSANEFTTTTDVEESKRTSWRHWLRRRRNLLVDPERGTQ